MLLAAVVVAPVDQFCSTQHKFGIVPGRQAHVFATIHGVFRTATRFRKADDQLLATDHAFPSACELLRVPECLVGVGNDLPPALALRKLLRVDGGNQTIFCRVHSCVGGCHSALQALDFASVASPCRIGSEVVAVPGS